MKQKRWISLLTAGVLAIGLVLTGCAPAQQPGSQPESSSQVEESSQEPETKVPTLYIGTVDAEGNGSFQEYPFVGSGKVTPEALIAAMAELTGWNLTLSAEDPVTTGKGGMTVSFAPESAIFTGPPIEQKEEFHLYSADQLCYTIFDSVQKTLQENFSPENPGALDIYYCTDGSGEIKLEQLGVVLPLDEPYSHALFEQLLMSAVIAEPDDSAAE